MQSPGARRHTSAYLLLADRKQGAVAAGVPKAEAEALVANAYQVCPYSNATRNNIDVKITVE